MDAKTKKRPNFVFILIDDLGWKDLGCYGSTFYETPNIDRLASEGVKFTNAYAAAPVCSPTRASIMSGKYPAAIGVTNFIGQKARGKLIDATCIDHLPLEEKTIARALKEHHYNTWHVGKWHLGGTLYYPEKHGFDVNIGGCHWGMPFNGYFSPWGIETLEDGPKGEYLTDRLTNEAIKLIKNNDGKPFYLNMDYYAVHIPIQGKPEYIEKYRTKARSMGLDKLKIFEEGEYFPSERKRHLKIKRRLIQSDPVYASMIQNLDENIGRLLKTVDEAGQADNTVIVFTSDNGGLSTAEGSPTCNAPLNEGKGWMYEGGVREPLIIKWPGIIKPGSICDVPVTSPDFYPTMLDIAGLPLMPDQHVDGISIVPLLRGENKLDRKTIFWHYPHYGNQGGTPGSSIRTGDYKLIQFFENGAIEFYDLRQDISERNNLASREPDRARMMQKMLAEWRQRVEAAIPESNPYFYESNQE